MLNGSKKVQAALNHCDLSQTIKLIESKSLSINLTKKFLTFSGNQIIQTLSMSRKPFFVQHQIQSTKFWLLQIQNGFHMDLSIQSVDEWFDGFLQVVIYFYLKNK